MRIFSRPGTGDRPGHDPETTVMQMQDYAARGMTLWPQRLLIYAAALVLNVFYRGLAFAAVCMILILLGEMFDARSFVLARRARADELAALRATLRRIHIGAFYGATVISFLVISLAMAGDGASPFMPMMLLFSAAVFAAMNTHQLLGALLIRLTVYGITFVLVPLLGLFFSGTAPTLETGLYLLTSLLMLYFIADCSVIGLRYYRANRGQMAQLRVENTRANAALASKTEFLATVSHELRTPLTSVRASLDIAMGGALGALPERTAQLLSIAQRNANRLGKLIDELLDLQKMDVGMMRFEFRTVQLAPLLSDALADNSAYAQDLDVRLKMLPVDTDIHMRADAMRLEQVITNLLSNAAKFSPAGSEVILAVTATQTQVRISVIDNGAGIDPADRARVFDSFSQLNSGDIRKVGGTGLGLSISRRIIEAHGGIIDFAANPRGGTIFFVELARTAQAAQLPDPAGYCAQQPSETRH